MDTYILFVRIVAFINVVVFISSIVMTHNALTSKPINIFAHNAESGRCEIEEIQVISVNGYTYKERQNLANGPYMIILAVNTIKDGELIGVSKLAFENIGKVYAALDTANYRKYVLEMNKVVDCKWGQDEPDYMPIDSTHITSDFTKVVHVGDEIYELALKWTIVQYMNILMFLVVCFSCVTIVYPERVLRAIRIIRLKYLRKPMVSVD